MCHINYLTFNSLITLIFQSFMIVVWKMPGYQLNCLNTGRRSMSWSPVFCMMCLVNWEMYNFALVRLTVSDEHLSNLYQSALCSHTFSFLFSFLLFIWETNTLTFSSVVYTLIPFFFIPLACDCRASLTEAVQGLCEASYNDIRVHVKSMKSTQPTGLSSGDSACWIINGGRPHYMPRCTDWLILLSSCLEKLNKQESKIRDLKKEDFLQISARHCLAKSTVNCILPQSRGFTMEQDKRLFTMNSLEQLLISSRLRYVLPLWL